MASNNMEYGININNYSRNNILTGNIASSNGKENIHVADPENNTINDSISKITISRLFTNNYFNDNYSFNFR